MTRPDAARALRIVLVRHGRSAHRAAGWLDADGLRAWLAAYDAAGIAADDRPPAPLRAATARAGLVAASDLPRALASARRLAPHAAIVATPLLREVPPAVPALGPLRLPLAAWALCVGVRGAARLLARVPAPAPALAQGAAAAAWLAALAGRHAHVVAVTHANVRRYVALALAADGWRRTPGGGRVAHWSAWTFTRGAGG